VLERSSATGSRTPTVVGACLSPARECGRDYLRDAAQLRSTALGRDLTRPPTALPTAFQASPLSVASNGPSPK